jgi:hypothetical protein
MKIVICGSIDFTPKIQEVAEVLIAQGHEVSIPFCSRQILNKEYSLEEFLAIKNREGDNKFRQNSGQDLIKLYYDLIKNCDLILVINIAKKGIENYIGGNVFLEIGFAHVLNKKIYLLNDIPDIPYYRDELKIINPIILNGNLKKLPS